MSGSSNINLVLNQGNAVKEIYNVKKQNLELQQQTNAQVSQQKRHEDKSKIGRFQTDHRIKSELQDRGRDHDERRGEGRQAKCGDKDPDTSPREENLIDILV